MGRHLWILGLALVAVTNPANAAFYGTARVDWEGVYFSNTGGVTTNLGGPWASPPYEATIVIDWDNDAYPTLQNSTLQHQALFCIELQQTAGSSDYFSVRDLEDAPLPTGAMGDDRATLLRKLWKGYSAAALASSPSTSNDPPASDRIASVAFAVSVWEIVFETQNPLASLDIDTGSFQLTGATVGLDSVKTIAQGYLDGLASISGQGLPTLYALTHGSRQDQLFLFEGGPQGPGTHDEPIPEPGTVVQLLGLGLMGLIAYRRFRRPRAA